MELLRRDNGPSLGHKVGYYGSVEVWAAMWAFPEAVKDGGDTAFKLAQDNASDMGTKQRRSEFAHSYDLPMSMLSQMELDSAQPTLFTMYPWVK